jgi:hypothetical protein
MEEIEREYTNARTQANPNEDEVAREESIQARMRKCGMLFTGVINPQ